MGILKEKVKFGKRRDALEENSKKLKALETMGADKEMVVDWYNRPKKGGSESGKKIGGGKIWSRRGKSKAVKIGWWVA